MSKLSKIIKPLVKITQQLKDYDEKCKYAHDMLEVQKINLRKEQEDLEQERKLTAQWLAAVPSVPEQV